jgi:hypothetical protein
MSLSVTPLVGSVSAAAAAAVTAAAATVTAAVGEWVLQNRPAAVVVETACIPEHGAAAGNAVTCRDQVQGAL